MDAKPVTPRDLFEGRVCYEIPPFQRPYVWTEEDQWQYLWDDIARVAEDVLEADPPDADRHHFLGAVVLKQLATAAGDPLRRSVIDGQQRLITLQILLDAAQIVIEEHGEEDDAESLMELVLNGAKKFKNTSRRFKLWPSRTDRVIFEQAMDNDLDVDPALAEGRIAQAHRFFGDAIREWSESTGDPEKARARLGALADVLQQRLQVVAIDLDTDDDDQLIFETLNDRGTPLLAADLIKNYVFQQCEEVGADVDKWADVYWQELDDDWWRDQVAQGRLYRSRIDLFLQYWLTMCLKDEIPTDAVFKRFRAYADSHLSSTPDAEVFLKGLRRDADTFREFAQLDPGTARGGFYTRVVEAFELGAFIPVLLWLISGNHDVPVEQADRALRSLESWAVRRTLLRQTMKQVNLVVVALLKELDRHDASQAGDATREFLLGQDAESRSWPTDKEMLAELPAIKAYGNIRQSRLRAVFAAIEQHLRSERHENVTLPERLEIEHVMPKRWQAYWGSDVAGNAEATARRDRLVHTIGNLTIITQKLNGALSNRPWTDAEALKVAPTGKDAGKGKRSLLLKFSILVLNKDITEPHEAAWTEADIAERATVLTKSIVEIWPRG